MTVLPMQIQNHRMERLAWGGAAENALLEYAGWLFPDPDGNPAIPIAFSEEWREFVVQSKASNRSPHHPIMVRWDIWWKRFIDLRIYKQSDEKPWLRHIWERAVERALSDPKYGIVPVEM